MSEPILVARSISRIVRSIVDEDLSIQDAMFRGYANISGIARVIKPTVEEIAGRRASLEGIITALKRITPSYKELSPLISEVVAKSVINVRTDVAKLSVEKNKRNVEKIRRMLVDTEEEFLQVSEGVSAITMIYNQSIRKDLLRRFGREDILEDQADLAAIMVHSPSEVIKTPSCAIAFYSQVSRRRINIEDTVSSYTDTVIVVRREDVGRAFSALTELLAEARRRTEGKRR